MEPTVMKIPGVREVLACEEAVPDTGWGKLLSIGCPPPPLWSGVALELDSETEDALPLLWLLLASSLAFLGSPWSLPVSFLGVT